MHTTSKPISDSSKNIARKCPKLLAFLILASMGACVDATAAGDKRDTSYGPVGTGYEDAADPDSRVLDLSQEKGSLERAITLDLEQLELVIVYAVDHGKYHNDPPSIVPTVEAFSDDVLRCATAAGARLEALDKNSDKTISEFISHTPWSGKLLVQINDFQGYRDDAEISQARIYQEFLDDDDTLVFAASVDQNGLCHLPTTNTIETAARECVRQYEEINTYQGCGSVWEAYPDTEPRDADGQPPEEQE